MILTVLQSMDTALTRVLLRSNEDETQVSTPSLEFNDSNVGTNVSGFDTLQELWQLLFSNLSNFTSLQINPDKVTLKTNNDNESPPLNTFNLDVKLTLQNELLYTLGIIFKHSYYNQDKQATSEDQMQLTWFIPSGNRLSSPINLYAKGKFQSHHYASIVYQALCLISKSLSKIQSKKKLDQILEPLLASAKNQSP